MSTNFDRRRINGPEDSFSPVLVDDDEDETKWRPGKPRQSRQPQDIRPIFLQPGLISQANGSAYIETERTKIACAVYGPRQSKNVGYIERGRLNVQVKFAPFSCHKRRAPIRDAEDRSIAVLIHQSLVSSVRLELFPKSTIDVFLTIIENDGIDSCVATGTVAASTALADAGIEMLGLVTSCAATLMGEEIWLDPNHDEATAGASTLVLACMPALNVVTSVWQNGTISPKQGLECMKACQERCETIHSIVAQSLVSNFTPE
ncbi:ribosomal protein S5 domain 2-type protein [Thelephora terrestris]|uniref:Ribosomal protein S5 domain 2-type protein n=1 Tax=Thelephora terrestris TaxID=56493 RepID=A0A9P6HLE7_9AGAM|nr:ribosomal protein S5 domain 2-type protein [Thelephora terrestris]